ncbi:hypothetical protein SDC9_195211 [bioreactor metagenome]|uniref:Uncharacterized protein n=1 Tax=bioreactor metagenome TaxID=1076179 RepID=A0A645I8L4_9ZZZZ
MPSGDGVEQKSADEAAPPGDTQGQDAPRSGEDDDAAEKHI